MVDEIPENVNERIRLIERAIKKRCRSLQVKDQDQHIEISGHAGRLSKEEKDALRALGIRHSTFGAKLYKERDEYGDYVKSLIHRGLITSTR
ncbi:MAG: hypothetical protein ABSD49_08620 [Candidatus Bathyarchaeia archaeon]|jgi:hypothetical protein